MILDGKIIACDRCKEPAVSVQGEVIDLWYSGKAHCHGGNIQAVTTPGGFPLRVSEVVPGSVHDITAARAHALPALYRAAAAGLPTLADPGYEGAGIGILIPVRQPAGGRELDINARTRNAIQRSLRCPEERGFALLTGRWRTLRHITARLNETDAGPRRVHVTWLRFFGGLIGNGAYRNQDEAAEAAVTAQPGPRAPARDPPDGGCLLLPLGGTIETLPPGKVTIAAVGTG